MYNGHILKERNANAFLPQPLPSGWRLSKLFIFFENHPLACDGAGWFSCPLILFF